MLGAASEDTACDEEEKGEQEHRSCGVESVVYEDGDFFALCIEEEKAGGTRAECGEQCFQHDCSSFHSER